jgi:hypothetical protein
VIIEDTDEKEEIIDGIRDAIHEGHDMAIDGFYVLTHTGVKIYIDMEFMFKRLQLDGLIVLFTMLSDVYATD